MDDSISEDGKASDAAAPAKRGRGRPKSLSDDERRQMIIATARRTFIELGLTGTTTDIVASRCRISKQTLYRLFPSKVDLFIAVVASHRQMMLRLPLPDDEDLPIAEAIGRIFMIDIDEDTERERAAFIHIVIRQSHQVPDLAEVMLREGLETSRRQLADWLAAQVTAGKLVLDEPMTGARILMDMLFGGVGPGPRGWPDLAARKVHMQRAIDIFVRGTRPD
ncbi:AcrR family transcriptional regulator [Neorhizobium galegae]|uniref:TetR/AcrR family transcriptional regulator n=1 Tax=Neorhizobium galegae TaxID=399 RepID=UPI001AE47BA3|nr:TetR/AcrR family transcriptional regulator [Neorhizobium galegae]MBP2549797.1 AcrR family transcriptional regulator [Neorhizobium galegae]